MLTFFIAFGVFLLIIVAMAIGYIVQKKSISGSCGGLSSVGVDKVCDCPEPCDKRKKKMANAALKQEQIKLKLLDD